MTLCLDVSCPGELKNPELFQYGEETMHAWMDQRLSDDIMAEQHKLKEAELVIFQVRGHARRGNDRRLMSCRHQQDQVLASTQLETIES